MPDRVPELVETSDFLLFRFRTLNGPAPRARGCPVPQEIGGLYVMLSRQDNENIGLMFSDNIHFWNESKVLISLLSHGNWFKWATVDRRSRRMPDGWF